MYFTVTVFPIKPNTINLFKAFLDVFSSELYLALNKASWWKKKKKEIDVEKQELMKSHILSTKRQQWKGEKTYYSNEKL